jgi:hypothetical protein
MLLESPARAERTYPPEDAEERRALVKRIVASSSFAKSNRLSEFLKYVYVLAEKGRFDDINEQGIGSAVFGRTRGYDPGVDSIVRSHASRLRHRLREYFEREGLHEPLILHIPRGSYIPAFELRTADVLPESTATAQALQDENVSQAKADVSGEKTPPPSCSRETPIEEHHIEPASRKMIQRLGIALIVAGVVIVLLAILLLRHTPIALRPRGEDTVTRNPLWKQFIAGPATKTVVVSSDSGLVMYEHLTGRPVSLASYMSGDYLKQTSSDTVPDEVVRKFGTRRYTPALDLTVLDRITRIFGEGRDRLSFRYARDVRMEDLKQGNAILLGSAESNPWVQLFEPSMNFLFQDDLLHDKAQMLNRHPLPGEALHYDSTPQDLAPTVYGVVAYRPTIQKSGHVLILEGQTMAGTQTAVDFVFDDSYLLPFLKKIRRMDGSIPFFELLLRSSSFGGQSSRIEIITYRTGTDKE